VWKLTLVQETMFKAFNGTITRWITFTEPQVFCTGETFCQHWSELMVAADPIPSQRESLSSASLTSNQTTLPTSLNVTTYPLNAAIMSSSRTPWRSSGLESLISVRPFSTELLTC